MKLFSFITTQFGTAEYILDTAHVVAVSLASIKSEAKVYLTTGKLLYVYSTSRSIHSSSQNVIDGERTELIESIHKFKSFLITDSLYDQFIFSTQVLAFFTNGTEDDD